ncbi:polysaccharide biosynthesis protein [Roseomonas mucosa]
MPQSSADLIQEIIALAPDGRAGLDAATTEALKVLTRRLLAARAAEGGLDEDPLELAMTRNVELHRDAAAARLAGRRILVTGGSGSVGTRLRQLLQGFGPAALFNLDIAPHHGEGTGITADIRDMAALDDAFREAQPDVVFHLAAIREPGRAEAVVREAVETNVFGSGNVIEACQRHGVRVAVYSSTGKCFAYVTDHVYTATKKLAEAQWMRAARHAAAGRAGGAEATHFAVTRFTHVLENGIIAADIQAGIEAGMIGLHGPDRHFNVQNLRQATHLLVNAAALAGEGPVDGFWSAVDLGWPVNTLDLALFQIRRSGRDVGLRFLGVPKGYDESFYRGQFDWSGLYEYHPLVNALEAPQGFTDRSGTMVGARVGAVPDAVLTQELRHLRQVVDGAEGAPGTVKQALLAAVTAVTGAVFATTPPERLLDVLWWGAAPAWAGPGASTAARYRSLVALLVDALLPHVEEKRFHACPAQMGRLREVAQTLPLIEGLQGRAAQLQALLSARHMMDAAHD